MGNALRQYASQVQEPELTVVNSKVNLSAKHFLRRLITAIVIFAISLTIIIVFQQSYAEKNSNYDNKKMPEITNEINDKAKQYHEILRNTESKITENGYHKPSPDKEQILLK
jgi:hypoxanthine phosphoribosyltransferase